MTNKVTNFKLLYLIHFKGIYRFAIKSNYYKQL